MKYTALVKQQPRPENIYKDISNPFSGASLVDTLGRPITYLRLSVTDRCDLRCTYCMAENMTFLPKNDLLTLDEVIDLSDAFIARGVSKIRLTGGEPLVRRGIEKVVKALGDRVKSGILEELTLTTNGTQLTRYAGFLAENGVRRINVSLDTLDPVKFKALTRLGDIRPVLAGLEAAKKAGLEVKINTVALRGLNETEIPSIFQWCISQGYNLTLIETMPLGNVVANRIDHYLPLTPYVEDLREQFGLQSSDHHSGGPARYLKVPDKPVKLGYITPLSQNFCATCNRLRVTATGRLYMCLGQNDYVDLKAALRNSSPDKALAAALDIAMMRKAPAHNFLVANGEMTGKVDRHMSYTGG